MSRHRDKSKLKKLAKERIKILFDEAEKVFSINPQRANRYVEMARKVAMKVNLIMPKVLKRRFCSHCYTYLKPGVNARKRIKDKTIILYCQNCKKYTKLGFGLAKKSTKE